MEFDLLVHIEKTDLYIAVANRWLPKFPQSRIVSNMVSNGMVRMFRNPTDEQDGQGHRAATDQKPGKQNNFNTAKSNYVWLPIRFENDMPIIDWYSEWRIEDYVK